MRTGDAGDTSDSLDARPDLHPPLDVPVPGAEAQLLLLAADGTPTHTAFMVVQTPRQLPVTRHQIQDTRTLEGPELLGFCCRKRLFHLFYWVSVKASSSGFLPNEIPRIWSQETRGV